MPPRSIKTPGNPATAIRADGREDFIRATRGAEKLRLEQTKLKRRLRRFCHAKNLIGDIRVWYLRRRLLARLRQRFERPQALFVGSSQHQLGRAGEAGDGQ